MQTNGRSHFARPPRTWKQQFCLGCAGLILGAGSSLADTNGLFLPSQPNGPGGQDQIQSTTGARCSQSINSSGGYLDIGLTSTVESDEDKFISGAAFSNNGSDMNVTGYARIVIPLGSQPTRLDCSRLYELEIQRLGQELELLKMGLE